MNLEIHIQRQDIIEEFSFEFCRQNYISEYYSFTLLPSIFVIFQIDSLLFKILFLTVAISVFRNV